jgi:hypothetical protein
VDNFATWSRALTAAEVEQWHNGGEGLHYVEIVGMGSSPEVVFLLQVIAVAASFGCGLGSVKFFIYVKNHKDIW